MVLLLSPLLEFCLNANFMDFLGVDNSACNEYFLIVGGAGLIIWFTAVSLTNWDELSQEVKSSAIHLKLL